MDRVARLDIASLPFVDTFGASFTADRATEHWTRSRSVDALFAYAEPTPVSEPRLLLHSPETAALLGFDEHSMRSEEFVSVLAGNRPLPGVRPYATNYGGHQFGSWAGQLGDGRAITIGEVSTPDNGVQTLQLKGAGPTPFSRGADGRAVLRSSMREFLCSEAMHHLGVPTTRALSLVATGETVIRDMFYDGNARPEPGAIVCRVSPTFLRFGHYQLLAARRDDQQLADLVDYTIRTWRPHLGTGSILAFFADVVDTTLSLVVHWTRIGFVHGVLNTDNMSILGLTIDYGPYGWLEPFDPMWTPNTTDATTRRYRFGAQAEIALWNLAQLANALLVLQPSVEPFQEILDEAVEQLPRRLDAMMANRLGWGAAATGDRALIDQLFTILASDEIDYTIFMRRLADVPTDPGADDRGLVDPVLPAWYQELNPGEGRERIVKWLRVWAQRCRRTGVSDPKRIETMNALNPCYVLRNYLAHQAIDDAQAGDLSTAETLLDVLRQPYVEQPGRERFAERRPEWARSRAGCSMLSCSS